MKKQLFVLFFIYGFALYAQTGLVAYFPLDSNANDYSPLHIHGINHNGVPVFTLDRQYFYFNGINAYIYAGNHSRNITDQVTVSVWIRTLSDRWQWIVGHYDWTADRGFQVVMANGYVEMRGRDGSGSFYRLPSSVVFNDGRWHHIGAVFDRNKWRLLVDCSASFTSLTSGARNPSYYVDTQPFSIAKYPQLNQGDPMLFQGDIDEVRVYNTALSPDELCQMYLSSPKAQNTRRVFLYPNPARDFLKIKIEKGEYEFKISDLSGKMVMSGKNLKSDGEVVIPVDRLSSGLYTIILESDEKGKWYGTFVKE
ncbi:MAG: T9SS type A sorting domain-containing protein [Chlorobi bacterium]|nr:T9SS type A sorting domain-containing protein [Chlorobiota bacterium]